MASLSSLQKKKRKGEKITLLTAYDSPMASFIAAAGVDAIIVSDAVGTIGNGKPEAFSVTVDEMIYHTRAVANGAGNCLVITTLPFGSYSTIDDAVKNATRVIKEGGAQAVHLEGTRKDGEIIEALVYNGIPVLGHIGVTKQGIARSGYIKLPGKTAGEAKGLLDDALEMERRGAFALILECLPDRIGTIITRALDIPTISIGSGKGCDGQALVTEDMLGIFKAMSPRFLKVYADIEENITNALGQFRQEVETGAFPGPEYSYQIDDKELEKLLSSLG